MRRVLPSDCRPMRRQRRVPPAAARAALDLLVDAAEPARFLYGPAKLEWPDGLGRGGPPRRFALAVGRRSAAAAVFCGRSAASRCGGHAERCACRARAATLGHQLPADRRTMAGRGPAPPLAIRLIGGLAASYGSYFRPLIAMLGRPWRATARFGVVPTHLTRVISNRFVACGPRNLQSEPSCRVAGSMTASRCASSK